MGELLGLLAGGSRLTRRGRHPTREVYCARPAPTPVRPRRLRQLILSNHKPRAPCRRALRTDVVVARLASHRARPLWEPCRAAPIAEATLGARDVRLQRVAARAR